MLFNNTQTRKSSLAISTASIILYSRQSLAETTPCNDLRHLALAIAQQLSAVGDLTRPVGWALSFRL